jgi:hypothetical protein
MRMLRSFVCEEECIKVDCWTLVAMPFIQAMSSIGNLW